MIFFNCWCFWELLKLYFFFPCEPGLCTIRVGEIHELDNSYHKLTRDMIESIILEKKKKYAKHILNSLNYTLKCRINWSLRIGSGISKKNIVSKHILKIPSIKKQKLFPCISLTILFYKLSDRYGNLPWNISISNTMIELLQRHLLLLLYSV